jgi:hypothetical protein
MLAGNLRRISYSWTWRFLSSSYLDLFFLDRGTLCRFLLLGFSSITPKSWDEIAVRGEGCNILDVKHII